jgi:hypothetical protein
MAPSIVGTKVLYQGDTGTIACDNGVHTNHRMIVETTVAITPITIGLGSPCAVGGKWLQPQTTEFESTLHKRMQKAGAAPSCITTTTTTKHHHTNVIGWHS